MAWPVAHTGIPSHSELVRRAKQCIKRYEQKLADGTADREEQSERSDIIRGAFEIAARELTTQKGTFLNTSYRSGDPESFRNGTAALAKRMTERFANKLNGKGTNRILKEEVDHYQKLVKKRAADAKEGGTRSKAAEERLQKTKKKRDQLQDMATQGDDARRVAETQATSSTGSTRNE